MNGFRYCILWLVLFFLVACSNEEKEFLTPGRWGVVLDVNVNEYLLNGIVIGKTIDDISNNNDLLIKPLGKSLKEIRKVEQENALRKKVPAEESKVKVHFDESLSYDVFYKVFATLGFNGYTSIQYVIGSNFKEPFVMDPPERHYSIFSEDHVDPFRCSQARTRRAIGEFSEKRLHKKISAEEIAARRVKDTELLIECARRYIDLSLALKSKGDTPYVVGLNEAGIIDGEKFYTYQNLDDVWKLIEDLRLRRALQDKEDRNQILVVLDKDIMIKNLVPVVKKLKAFGYKMNFAFIGF